MTRACRHLALVLIAALFAAGAVARAQDGDVVITSSVDRSTVTVGDVIRYTLSVEWADGIDLTPPPLGINLGRFEVRDYQPGKEEARAGGRTRVSTTYQVAVYESGDFAIPGVPIAYQDRNGKARTVDSEPIDIRVESVAPDTGASPRDIREPAEIPVDWRPYAIAGALALAVLATAVFGYLYWLRRRRRRMRLDLGRERPPADRWALAELDRLRAEGHIEAGRIEAFYVGVSTIARGYVERRFYLPALKRTTSEIVRETEALGVPSDQIEMLRSFLDDADLVKFARHDPGSDAPAEMMARARELVERTRLTPDRSPDAAEDQTSDTQGGEPPVPREEVAP